MSSIVKALKVMLVDQRQTSGTVVKQNSSGSVTVRTPKGLINALPPAGAQVSVGSSVIVNDGNIYVGLSNKKSPKIYKV